MSPGVLVAEIGGLARTRLLHRSVLPQGLDPLPDHRPNWSKLGGWLTLRYGVIANAALTCGVLQLAESPLNFS